ncbi:hypothetical protein CFOL_v3_26420 [Cephalotus follicularis]|uniref:Epimerase domain-containing protein n=1 Tax=Cephalotus follicularis TaxID=3775 RepID=A0A1Q3CRU8_CEPFO|nr:hypothetical protein CFOL_v3_26420 [Cephalotus follicularis]
MIMAKDIVDKLKIIYPNYNYPNSFTDGKEEQKISYEKLQKLGWSYRPLEETLIDSIKSFHDVGQLD